MQIRLAVISILCGLLCGTAAMFVAPQDVAASGLIGVTSEELAALMVGCDGPKNEGSACGVSGYEYTCPDPEAYGTFCGLTSCSGNPDCECDNTNKQIACHEVTGFCCFQKNRYCVYGSCDGIGSATQIYHDYCT